MDNDVSRYWVCDREDEPFMERCEDGDWVYFEDYASLAAERDALEARVAAADKLAVILAEAMHEHDTADYGYGEENPWTMKEWFSDEDRTALAAYEATKEQSK